MNGIERELVEIREEQEKIGRVATVTLISSSLCLGMLVGMTIYFMVV